MIERALEFPMTDLDFARVQTFVKRQSGIDLGEAKRMLVYGRLAKRLRQLGLTDFRSYLDLVEEGSSDEPKRMLNAITTNVTEFFRENHHFELLEHRVIPDLLERNARDRRIRIWSAGCSTGEEPYSIALVLSTLFSASSGWDVKVLATDIDSDVLAHAEKGEYPYSKIAKLPVEAKRQGFLKGTGGQSETVRVKEDLRKFITFRQLNLLEPWPMQGAFDLIFCRNVVIYFDAPTKAKLIGRFLTTLTPTGYLFVGHSESLVGVQTGLRTLGPTAHQKTPEAPARSS
jgi:chemotaxis protein methyltransferase CheR